MAVQAVLLGLIPLAGQVAPAMGAAAGVLLALVSTAIKAGVLALAAAPRGARGRRADRGRAAGRLHHVAACSGWGCWGLALHVAGRLPLPGADGTPFLVPVALFTMMVGLSADRQPQKAVMQALGYLAMENGIYAFGLAFAVEEPLLVEMGVLLDVFVAVFVMGIAIHHISREFDHIDTDRLSALKD